MNKQIMFITEDGVEIYKGDSYFRVWNDLLLSPTLITNAGNRDKARWREEDKISKLFSTYNKAKEYMESQN